jgi:hypothetical protein
MHCAEIQNLGSRMYHTAYNKAADDLYYLDGRFELRDGGMKR